MDRLIQKMSSEHHMNVEISKFEYESDEDEPTTPLPDVPPPPFPDELLDGDEGDEDEELSTQPPQLTHTQYIRII